MTDLSGTQVPFDTQFMAQDALIHADLTKFNENVMQLVQTAISGGTLGAGSTTAIGSLMVAESNAYRLLLYPPYLAKTFETDMPAYNFLEAYLVDSNDIEISSGVKKVRCVWRAIPQWNEASGGWTLFNTSATGKPATN